MVDGEGDRIRTPANARTPSPAIRSGSMSRRTWGHTIRMNWTGAPNDIAARPAELKAFIDRCVPEFRTLATTATRRTSTS